MTRRSHGLANRPGKPYPATFRICQWTHRESNPDFQSAELVSSRWTMSPQLSLPRSSLRRSRISRSSLALNRPFALPIHRKLVHMVHRTFRRRLPAVFRRRLIVDRPGSRTPISWLQARCLPVGPAAQVSRGPSGNRTRSPSLPRRCATGTPTDHSRK